MPGPGYKAKSKGGPGYTGSKKKRAKKKPDITVTPNAVLGGAGVKRASKQAEKAHRSYRRRRKAMRRAIRANKRLNERTGREVVTARSVDPKAAAISDKLGLTDVGLSKQDKAKQELRGMLGKEGMKAIRKAPKHPSDLEFGIMLATGGRGTALKGIGRAVMGARTAEKAAGAAKAAAKAGDAGRAAKRAKDAARAASRAKAAKKGTRGAKKSADKAKKAADEAAKAAKSAPKKKPNVKTKVKGRYTKEERAFRRARRGENTLNSAANPLVPAAVTADERPRALVEGHLKADLGKSALTTARAIPATFSFLAGAGADVARAAATGDTGPLKGTAKEGKDALKSLEPLVSGDAGKVKKAVEDEVGYVFAPLLPRGAISTPARAVGRGVKKVAKKAAPKPKPRTGKPSKARTAVNFVTQRGDRRTTARIAAQEQHAANFEAQRAARRVERKARKAKKARSLRNVKGREAGDAISVLTTYGISRKNASSQLDDVRNSLDPAPGSPDVNTRAVIDWLKENPKVLKDDALWKAVDQAKKEARDVETSPRAKHLAQARVIGDAEGNPILKPEERAPKAAQKITGKASRAEAWNALKQRRKEIAKLKGQHRKAQRAGNHARAGNLKASLRALEAEERALTKSLKKLTRPGQEPTIRARRKPWTKDMVDDFAAETKARAAKRGMEEPTWTAEPRLPTEPDAVAGAFEAGGAQPRRTHIKTGKSEKGDLADRSYTSYIQKTVMAPRIAKGMARFVRRWSDKMARAKSLDGKARKVFTGEEARRLYEEGKFNPQTEMLVPSRHVKAALDAEDFDAAAFHSEASKQLRGEFDAAKLDKGTKYIVVSREAGKEFLDQISPQRGGFEAATSAFGTGASRIILGMSPAWLISQIPATGFQALASMSFNPVAFARAAYHVNRLKHENPKAYEQLAARAGRAGPLIDQPSSLRAGMEQPSSSMRRALRQSAIGRRIDEATRLQTLGIIDRWQTGKFREIALAAKLGREYNGFKAKFAAPLRQQSGIAKRLKGMSRTQQLEWFAKHPKALDKHIDYLNQVMGDWHTYTRAERQLAGALIFYPFVRMSLTWPTRFAKHHPTTASALYLLAQENANNLEQLLGKDNMEFLDYANAVVHGDDGEADLLMPGARRFAAPGLNVLSESLASNNPAGVLRALNPVMSAPIFGLTRTDPFTGEKSDKSVDELLKEQALSLAAPLRFFDLHRSGEVSPASQALRDLDPKAKERGIVNPFATITVDRAKQRAEIIKALDDSGLFSSEVGQFSKMAEKEGVLAAARKLVRDTEAGDFLKGTLPGDPASDANFEEVSDVFYALRFADPKEQKRILQKLAQGRKAVRKKNDSGGLGSTGLGSGGGLSGGGL